MKFNEEMPKKKKLLELVASVALINGIKKHMEKALCLVRQNLAQSKARYEKLYTAEKDKCVMAWAFLFLQI
jgi:hypothetical protein